MHIEPVDVHDPAWGDDLFGLHNDVHAADRPDDPPPLLDPFLTMLRQDHPDMRAEVISARRDGALAGWALLALPTADNLHLAQAMVEVHPRHRRRGVGSRLLGELAARALAQARGTLVASATEPVPGGPPRDDAGTRFLQDHGFVAALSGTARRVDLSRTDQAAEQRLLDECLPYAVDYERVTWTGPTPDRLAGEVAYLANRIITDSPMGDIDVEMTTMDGQRLHAEERNAQQRGTHLVGAAALHRTTGQVAAVTRVDVRPPGDHGAIWLTIAHPDHRGHRLGTIVKIEVHRLVRREFPDLRYVHTGNADANDHMVAINERLGYVPYEAITSYQRKLA